MSVKRVLDVASLLVSVACALSACTSESVRIDEPPSAEAGSTDGAPADRAAPDGGNNSETDSSSECDEEALRCWDNTPQTCLDGVWTDQEACSGDRPACMRGVCQAAVVQVAAGPYHTCALRSTGQVKCWGGGIDGQLGLEDPRDRGAIAGDMGDALPAVHLGTGESAVAIGSGFWSTCVLLASQGIKCWGGFGGFDNVGDKPGDMGDNLPARPIGAGVEVLTLGPSVCTLSVDNGVDCWGGWQVSEGDAHTIDFGDRERVVQFSTTGGWQECALFQSGSLACWRGDMYDDTHGNQYGQLGLGDTVERPPPGPGDPLELVDLGTGRRAVRVTACSGRTCAILDDGSAKCWGLDGVVGRGLGSELGYPESGNRGDEPGEIGDNLPALSLDGEAERLECAESTTCALLADGAIECWGIGKPWASEAGPRPVRMPFGRRATGLSVGTFHACAVLDTGQITCWGGNGYGQLGLGDRDARDSPEELPPIDLGSG